MRFLLPLFLLVTTCCSAQSNLSELDKAIQMSSSYDKAKEKNIATIKSANAHASGDQLFQTYSNLYEEYKVYNYDSAFSYGQKLLNLAYEIHDPSLVNCSRIKLGFILLSAGLFKEALDTLQMIKLQNLPCKAEYYTLLARCYYDLADYTMDSYHSPAYNNMGNTFLDSALKYQATEFDKTYYSGLRLIRSGKIDTAKIFFQKLVNDPSLTLHQQALATSTMSDVYIQKEQPDSAIPLLVRAAIADIRSSTKETSAIFNLSNLLYKKGDSKNASTYIEKAVKDAVYYGARQRKVQMSTILPLIEGEKILRVENEKKTVTTYAIIVTMMMLLLIYLTFIIARQNKKLQLAQKALKEANAAQQQMNTRLMEANKIKEEYIGFFFNGNTAFYDKVEQFKKKAEKKIAEKKPEELLFLVKNLHIKEERDELLKNFDDIFLRIFPHFIASYNALFDAGNQVSLRENEVLNTELRIFALIRLGIHDNDKIAAILGYSVNTINTYKTRVKNRSFISNEEFEQRIMEIPSI
jgi:hypothetical protein